MEHYVTVFDGVFLPQGIALHRSLQRHAGEYTLWVMCVDIVAYDVLQKLSLPNVRLIGIKDIETDELREAKQQRTTAEYCWTLTPQSVLAVIDRDPAILRVTYVDADFSLLRSPAPIFDEFDSSGKQVLITDHAYAPDYDQTHMSGRYCVQFVTFCRGRGEEVLNWWADQCLEWCFARFEDGKFGDQKYLDDWPERFADLVHVLQKNDLILTPWNAIRFPYGPAVAYHFHNLRLLSRRRVMLIRGYDVPKATQVAVYQPYLQDLSDAVAKMEKIGHLSQPQGRKPGPFIQTGILIRKLLRVLARIRPITVSQLPVPENQD